MTADQPSATDESNIRTTPVDGEIIHNVARNTSMGAGGLKGILVGLDSGEDLEELPAEKQKPVRKALEKQGRRQADKYRDMGVKDQRAYSYEFGTVVTVTRIHNPLPDAVLDGYQAVEVEKPNGAKETTTLDTLAGVLTDSVQVKKRYGHAEGMELLWVLDAGIQAFAESEQYDGEANAARELRESIKSQLPDAGEELPSPDEINGGGR